MTTRTNEEKAMLKGQYEARMKSEELERTIEGLKTDPLYRETVRTGFDYDTGDPFRNLANSLVNIRDPRNIVLRTSSGFVWEATPQHVRYGWKDSTHFTTELEFNPSHPHYPFEPPYFTRVAKNLSYYVRLALENRETINIETNVESPFKTEQLT